MSDERESKRNAMLQAGRTLAETILHQWRRLWAAPLNRQEQKCLDDLQAAWTAWECDALTHAIDVEKEFDSLNLLRPPLQKLPDLAKMLRAHGVLEWNLLSLGLARKRGQTELDGGFWGSAGPGI